MGTWYRVAEWFSADSFEQDAIVEAAVRLIVKWDVPTMDLTKTRDSYVTTYNTWIVDNSLPKLVYDSPQLNVFQMYYWGKPIAIETPTLQSPSTYDSGYTHKLYAVPDGLWHENDCVVGQSQT